MKDRVLIIDGLNFIYRGVISFGTKAPVDESKPDYTIVYNFFRNLRALIERFNPTHCFFILEGNPKFRKELFPEYKKNRLVKTGSKEQVAKDNVSRQAQIICELLPNLPITLVKAEAFEADDTIYTLADNLKNEQVIIVSTDSDLIQILQALSKYDVKIFHPGKKEFTQPPEYNYLVWKCIAGDKQSDNIPGILSAAKATKIAQNPDMLSSFLTNEEYKSNFLLNKKLIELRLVPPHELIFTNYNVNFELLFNKFEIMNLPSLLKEEYKTKFITTFRDLNVVKF